jgi:hypothetical protein
VCAICTLTSTQDDVDAFAKLPYETSDATSAAFIARLVARYYVADPLLNNVVDVAMLYSAQGTPELATQCKARAQNVLYEFL